MSWMKLDDEVAETVACALPAVIKVTDLIIETSKCV